MLSKVLHMFYNGGDIMSTTQEIIARKVGLDRSTVSKILNGKASDFVSQKTVGKVLKAARELGYDFGRLRHTHSRQFERAHLNLKAKFKVILGTGEVYDSGSCVITNLSVGNALIEEMVSKRWSLPMKPFSVSLTITEGRLKGISMLGRVTRMDIRDQVRLAMEFVEVDPASARKLRKFMEKKVVSGVS